MKTLALLACLAGLGFAAPAIAQAPPPVEAFGRLPAIADVAISPDGRRIAVAASTASGDGVILIVTIDDPNAERPRYGVGERTTLRGVGWADDERVTYLISQTFQPGQVLPPGYYFRGRPHRIDYYRHGAINLRTGRAEALTTNPENPWADQGARLLAPIEGDPGFARMIGRTRTLERNNAQVFRINLDTGRVSPALTRGVNRDTIDFVVDRAGALVARTDRDDETNRWQLFVYDGDEPRLLAQEVSEYGDPLSIEGLLPDGRLVAHEWNEAGFSILTAVDRTNGQREVLFEQQNTEIDGAIFDPWTREIVGVAWRQEETQVQFFDPALQAVQQQLAGMLENSSFRIETWSRDRTRFIVYMERGLGGGVYLLFDTANPTTLTGLGSRYPELANNLGGERQAITYRARDGVRIPAYLTLPGEIEHRNMPLVVLVHGGPHNVRDDMGFDYWASFLASRGYAVLQPNFRGSGGYGAAWEDAGRRQWGGLMQTDVEDGAAALVRAGIADASRICIVGASYGGYAALAGVTLTPDRYRCAISVAGVSDLGLMLTQTERQTGADSSSADWWRASIGDRAEDRERIRSVSPALLADRVRAPILLIHGTDDTVVPIEQSRRMQRALSSAGKDVRFVELRGDDHWLSDAPTRIQMLREIETFLAQHLGNGQ
jgi:dipeptidyl aminopeptidase/acylaminoacyl peptidase